MIDTMGIILTNNDQIPPLTDKRAVAALPVAGRFRLIDFILSSMANAGMTNIGIVTESNYSSLMDHVKSGKPWDLDRKNEGLTILPPNIARLPYGMIRGNIDMLSGISDYIRKSSQTYVILSLGNYIYNIDFEKVLDEHIKSQADITAVYKDMKDVGERELSRFSLFDIDSGGRIRDIEVMPFYPKTHAASMDLYIMEKTLLESIIDECSARGDHDFVKDALAKKLGGLRLFGYEHTDYMDKIDCLKAYYKNNMIFLNPDLRNVLFNPEKPVYTKVKDQYPAKYGEDAVVCNCFVSDGCIIEGRVENSVLSRGVRIEKGAFVRNSIIMQDSVIGEGAFVDYVVFDKETCITAGKKLIGQENYPLAIAKGTVI